MRGIAHLELTIREKIASSPFGCVGCRDGASCVGGLGAAGLPYRMGSRGEVLARMRRRRVEVLVAPLCRRAAPMLFMAWESGWMRGASVRIKTVRTRDDGTQQVTLDAVTLRAQTRRP